MWAYSEAYWLNFMYWTNILLEIYCHFQDFVIFQKWQPALMPLLWRCRGCGCRNFRQLTSKIFDWFCNQGQWWRHWEVTEFLFAFMKLDTDHWYHARYNRPLVPCKLLPYHWYHASYNRPLVPCKLLPHHWYHASHYSTTGTMKVTTTPLVQAFK